LDITLLHDFTFNSTTCNQKTICELLQVYGYCKNTQHINQIQSCKYPTFTIRWTQLTQTQMDKAPSAPSGSSQSIASKITDWVKPGDKSGEFKRQQSIFRNHISSKPGAEFPAEAGRYHLYVSYACPWAHRTLIVRKLKGLEDIIPYTSVHWHLGDKGWRFATAEDNDAEGEFVRPDPVEGHEGFTHLRDIYFSVQPDYSGRFTVPTLYDTKQHKIVSNESADILRMFYTEFDALLPEDKRGVVLYPKDLQSKIDANNEWVYDQINNGVYKSGFATTQEAYDKNVTTLFSALDRVESDLSKSPGPYYWGSQITESDIRLFTTIVRFDPVYQQHFKCNIRDIRGGYPNIHRWLRHLYWTVPAFKDTTNFLHIKRHYTRSHSQVNPHGITPVGPLPDILPEDEEIEAVKAALTRK
jgi:glutathionyl-hydroquinone reductase